jgi:hypothetical protein
LNAGLLVSAPMAYRCLDLNVSAWVNQGRIRAPELEWLFDQDYDVPKIYYGAALPISTHRVELL